MGQSIEACKASASRKSVIGTTIDWFIPEELKRSDEDTRRHARVIVAAVLTMMAIGAVYVAVYYRIGVYAPGNIAAAAVGIALVCLRVLHWTKSCTLTGNLIAAELFVTLTSMAMFMGGASSPTVIWYSGIPIVATSLAGRRAGMFWLALTLLALVIFAATENQGYIFLDDLTAGQHRWLGLLALMGMVLLIQVLTEFFERFKDQMLRGIRQNEARFRLAAEMSSDLIYEWDVTTHELRWFGDVDAALGCHGGEFPHTLAGWFERMHPDDQARLQSHAERYSRATSAIWEEYQIRYEDGSWRYWIDRAAPVLDNDGRAVRWVGTCTDITERRQAEDQLRKTNTRLKEQTVLANAMAAQAEAASRSKSEFLANMSHEIRTPMTAIRGFAEILRDEALCCHTCAESSTCNAHRQSREYIDTICRNTQYLLSLINDILDLSKIEAGGLIVEQITCSPCAVVAEVESLMRVRSDAKGLEFIIEYESMIPESILSDPTRLRQVLINLLGNAVKFTEIGGIRLVVRYVPGERPTMEFDVWDTGVGMTPEQTARVFQPFTQADSSTTRRFGGSGLGLTISKRLAQLLGGDVAIVDTDTGIGTRFRLTVAAPAPSNAQMVEDPKRPLVSEPAIVKNTDRAQQELEGRILLAEDGPDNQRLIGFILRKAGAEVTVVENGELAVEAALSAQKRGTPFDVILMDMQMPVMDGYEATWTLRTERYTGIIIALTAHAMASDRQKCLDTGCDDYTSKPIDRQELVKIIRYHLHTRYATVAPENG
jgi:PAS domain S-box-containing protein